MPYCIDCGRKRPNLSRRGLCPTCALARCTAAGHLMRDPNSDTYKRWLKRRYPQKASASSGNEPMKKVS